MLGRCGAATKTTCAARIGEYFPFVWGSKRGSEYVHCSFIVDMYILYGHGQPICGIFLLCVILRWIVSLNINELEDENLENDIFCFRLVYLKDSELGGFST